MSAQIRGEVETLKEAPGPWLELYYRAIGEAQVSMQIILRKCEIHI